MASFLLHKVEIGRLNGNNLFFGTSLFSSLDEEEMLGLPLAASPTLVPTAKPPDNATTVKSCVNVRKETLNFSTGDNGDGVLKFVFDTVTPCSLKLKWKEQYVFEDGNFTYSPETLN